MRALIRFSHGFGISACWIGARVFFSSLLGSPALVASACGLSRLVDGARTRTHLFRKDANAETLVWRWTIHSVCLGNLGRPMVCPIAVAWCAGQSVRPAWVMAGRNPDSIRSFSTDSGMRTDRKIFT